MKIDFHCHTKVTKSGESLNRNVSPELFRKKIIQAEVKVVVISNHNHFDLCQFDQLQDAVKDECILWPGVELDIVGNSGKTAHLVLVSNPKLKKEFSLKLDKLIGDTHPDEFEIPVSDLLEYFQDLDIIYSPHHLKSKQMSLEDIEVMKEKMVNPNRLLWEPSTLFGVGVLNAHGLKGILGSDGHPWSEYEKVKLGNLKFEISSFESFCKALDRDFVIMEDLRSEFFNKSIKVYGNYAKKEFEFAIPIYNDINIIYGDKGSGKSEILDSLNEYFINSESVEPVFYKSGESDTWFKSMLKIDREVDSLDYVDDDFSSNFKEIKEFIDTTPTSIKSYFMYYTEKTKNKKIQNMLCLDIEKNHSYDERLLSIYKNEFKEINDFRDKIKSFKLYDEIKRSQLIESLKELSEMYEKRIFEEFVEQKAQYLFDDFVEEVQKLASENTGKPVKPTSTGFAVFARNRFKLNSNVNEVLFELDKDKKTYIQTLGNIGSKGTGIIETTVNYMNNENKNDVRAHDLEGKKIPLVQFINQLEEINYSLSENELGNCVQNMALCMDENEIKSVENFLAIKKEFKIHGLEGSYKPSKGEMAILNLQHNLISQTEKEVFLIDEPELSLGGKYIEENILPLLLELGKKNKIVVIATHNANLAVRTRPINSIYKKVDNNIYTTYVGSMFTDVLKNIDNPNDVESWLDTSMAHLEGGDIAFYERRSLYDRQ